MNGFFNCMALAPRQLGIATQRAMLKTAQKINDAETEEMKRVFDHPTRWFLGSIRIPGVYQRFLFSIGNAIKRLCFLAVIPATSCSLTLAVSYSRPMIMSGQWKQQLSFSVKSKNYKTMG